MKHNFKIALVVGAVLVAAVTLLAWLRHPHSVAINPAATNPAIKGTPRYWFDPMHPSEHFDKPGKSPFMDMQMLPKYDDPVPAGGAVVNPGVITIDSRVVANLGIRLAPVEQGDFSRDVDSVGLVAVDEHRIEVIQVRERGWVERLEVRAVGDMVHRGQLLAGVYSPDLLSTQQELLIARDSQDPQLIEAAKRRLQLFGLSATQIARVEKAGKVERRVDYIAPFDGYVMDLGIRQGAAVEPGTTLFQLADLSSVWLIAEVPEIQSTWIKVSDRANVEVPALPGVDFAGHVDYVYPELNQATRTVKVRIVLVNPHLQLRPGMFASAHFRGRSQRNVLTVPTEAVIQTGTRSVIIVADDDRHFHPALVRIGTEHGGRSEVLAGLHLGQNVVASGQFLIDSEASLRGAFDNLAGSQGYAKDEVH